MRRVRAIANGTQAVEGRNANPGREIPVRTASNGDFVYLKSQLVCDSLGSREKRCNLLSPLQRRSVHSATNLQLAIAIDGLERFQLALHQWPIGFAGYAQIDLGHRLAGHDVRPRASTNDSHVERDASLQVGKLRNRLNLVCQLGDGAVTLLEIQSGV
jgi:hypothetical protein